MRADIEQHERSWQPRRKRDFEIAAAYILRVTRFLNTLTNLFPIWVLAGGVLALIHPPLFTWFRKDAIVWGLAVIMLGMGVTLSVDDFKRVLAMPRAIATGFFAQFLIMPFLGWSVAHLLKLDTAFAVGLILVGCCPGGTASNVVAYLARANVPLSVLMTTCTTFGAIVLTPALTKWLAGTYVDVNGWGLFWDTVRVVLAPLLIGLILHHGTPRLVKTVIPIMPLISVATIALICASVIGQNAANIRKSGGLLLLAVFLLHAGGFALGHLFARLFGYGEIIRRTVSIEVGMQNSGLGVVLAQNNFPQMPATATPCAISAVFHSVIGSLLAAIWRFRPPNEKAATPAGAGVAAPEINRSAV
jgi:BASS family bile acid:Na+ symporter